MSTFEFIKRKPLANSALGQVITTYSYCCRYHPSALGEILREWAFIGNALGCYDDFEVRPDFTERKITEREFQFLMGRSSEKDHDSFWDWNDGEVFERAQWFVHPNGIEMGWFWDGDGVLVFYVPELTEDGCSGILISSDCKKTDEWKFQEVES